MVQNRLFQRTKHSVSLAQNALSQGMKQSVLKYETICSKVLRDLIVE